MRTLFFSLIFAAPFFANAAQDTCKGSGYTVEIKGSKATVSGPNANALPLKKVAPSGDPEDKNSWPEYANFDGSIDLTYFNAVDPSGVSKTKFTARLDINDAPVDLICENP